MTEHEIVYIGRDFYLKSGTSMSAYYRLPNWERSGIGDIETLVESGDTVNVRRATEQEMSIAYVMWVKFKWGENNFKK